MVQRGSDPRAAVLTANGFLRGGKASTIEAKEVFCIHSDSFFSPAIRQCFWMARAYLGLGSNVGDREVFLEKAIEMLGDSKRVKVLRRAGFYETEPVGREDQAWFINTVAEIETSLPPPELLAHTQSIESTLGRQKREHWGPREIDLDILLYEDRVLDMPALTIPHSQLHRRRFVLAPLCELAPTLVHPIFRRSMRELLEGLSDTKQVISLRAKKF